MSNKIRLIHNSYFDEDVAKEIKASLAKGMPLNIRTKEYIDARNHIRQSKLLNKQVNNIGYEYVILSNEIVKHKTLTVHRLMAKTFLDDYSSLEQVDSSHSYTLLPGEREEHATALMCRYCGNYKVGIDRIVLEDYFRIFRLSSRCPTPMEVHVLPRVLQPERLSLFSSTTEGLRLTNNQNSPFPDAETRTYRLGDSPRMIHWKAFARRRSAA